jgi:heterotetrameric sarcosine oxidase delta subunit
MIIPHPLLGPRDASEFTYLGDASLLLRPDAPVGDPSAQTMTAFHDYVHLRDNPHGIHRELWFHEQGDRSWLVVTRNVSSHEILSVELATQTKTTPKKPRKGGKS